MKTPMKTDFEKDSGKNSYLTFRLEEEQYAVHVNNVLNILELPNITKIPDTPDYMRGVINLRGTVLPLIDTRIKLNMGSTEYTDNTCIVVMETGKNGEKIYFGSLVDQVESVHKISEDEIKSPSDLGNIYKSRFITGIAEKDSDFILVLDIDKMFDSDEMESLKENTELNSEQI